MPLPFADLEAVYEALAETLDGVPPDRRELFLTKLALLLANELDDAAPVLKALAAAQANLA